MQRLFTGLKIPEDIGEQLMVMQAGLENVRWIDPVDFHVTLRFFGEMAEPLARELSKHLKAVQMEPFEVQFSKAGWFGRNKPHSLHIEVEQCAGLDMLHYHHEMLARALGFEPVSRKFAPHITIARLRQTPKDQLEDYVARHGVVDLRPFEVNSFALFSAKPSGGGGPYVVEEVFG